MKLDDVINTEQITLEKLRFAATNMIPRNCFPLDLDVEEEYNVRLQGLFTSLSWSLLGKHVQTIRYPSTWWDAFKERWFPGFMRSRFPIQYEKYKLHNICPHINYVFDKNQKVHFQWIEENIELSHFKEKDE